MIIRRHIRRFTILLPTALLLLACSGQKVVEQGENRQPITCSPAWFETVEKSLNSGDGYGHGPDLGSDEWMSVVEFRLGVRGQTGLPERGSDAWCDAMDKLMAAGELTK